jgi:hypothetical protein
MKEEQLRTKTLLFSKRYKCYGQCLKKEGFMAYVLFVRHLSAWYHCVELESSHYTPEGKQWEDL